MKAAGKLLKYLEGTCNMGLFYSTNFAEGLTAYSDSDFSGDKSEKWVCETESKRSMPTTQS